MSMDFGLLVIIKLQDALLQEDIFIPLVIYKIVCKSPELLCPGGLLF